MNWTGCTALQWLSGVSAIAAVRTAPFPPTAGGHSQSPQLASNCHLPIKAQSYLHRMEWHFGLCRDCSSSKVFGPEPGVALRASNFEG